MKNVKFHVSESADALSNATAEWVTGIIEKNIETKQQCTWVLSGGSTPKKLYELLATDKYKQRIDWRKVHVFFGDERVVPFTSDKNNGRLAYDALLSSVPIPENQIHYMNTGIEMNKSADEYESTLRKYFQPDGHTFDLVLLGMGDDGHTLSLFPGTTAVQEKNKWVITAKAPVEPLDRITLTAPVVNSSACIAFLVTGAGKAAPLEAVIEGEYQPHLYPAQIIKPRNGELHLFADNAAAGGLSIKS